MNNSKKIFVFTDKNEFYNSLSETAKSTIFTGKYTVIQNNKIEFDVVNLAKTNLKKEAEFYFEDELLYLTMHTETNFPIKYALEKVEE